MMSLAIRAALPLAVWAAASQAAAEPFQPLAFDAATTGTPVTQPLAGSSRSALDILREVYPDLAVDGRATRANKVAAIPDAVDEGPPETQQSGFDLSTTPASYAVLGDDTARYAAVLAGDVLIVAQLVPEYRLIGMIAVRTDPGGWPAGHEALMLAPDGPAALIVNAHFNSQEGFQNYALVGVTDGELRLLHDGPFLYSFAGALDGCDTRKVTQQLERVEPRRGRNGRLSLAMEVTEASECERDGRTVATPPRRFPMTLRWDRVRREYVGGSKALDARNRRRMGV